MQCSSLIWGSLCAVFVGCKSKCYCCYCHWCCGNLSCKYLPAVNMFKLLFGWHEEPARVGSKSMMKAKWKIFLRSKLNKSCPWSPLGPVGPVGPVSCFPASLFKRPIQPNRVSHGSLRCATCLGLNWSQCGADWKNFKDTEGRRERQRKLADARSMIGSLYIHFAWQRSKGKVETDLPVSQVAALNTNTS